MSRRLKVLISAFACRPGKGSEPEVGWRWAMGMARFHDVTVLTQLKHRPAIEEGLAALPPEAPRPDFRYFSGGRMMAGLRQRFGGVRLFYIWWQKAAWPVIHRLHAEIGFDLIHHVTFAGYRYTTAIWGHGVPCIWGPVGGMESMPLRLLPKDHLGALLAEAARNLNNAMLALPFHVLPRRVAASTIVLVSTRETQQVFEALGARPILMPTIGMESSAISQAPRPVPSGPLELLFVGRIISLKGVDLAIRALHRSGTQARLTFIGSGSYLPKARRLAARLGLAERVQFLGQLSHSETQLQYRKHDLFLFPSLHDSGGFAVLEAMGQGLPVICLDCGGPAISVRDGCGIRVPMSSRGEVVEKLAEAIQVYDQDRERVATDGRRAREVVSEQYDWERKFEEMDGVYQEATKPAERRRAAIRHTSFIASARHLVFTTRGVLFALLLICAVAWLQMQSIRQLNHAAERIVTDRLPSLSLAAIANEKRNTSFIKTLLLLDAPDGSRDLHAVAEIERLSRETTAAFQQYEEILSDRIDRDNFDKLQTARAAYLDVRKGVLADFTQGRQAQARQDFEQRLLPAFEAYSTATESIVAYNIDAGKRDGEEILRLVVISQWVLAGLGVVIFITGFLLGLSKI